MQSGYVYKRAPQSTAWQQRYVTLSTDTGTMKFFAEKSGNRIQKGSVSIKQGTFRVLDQVDIGHPYAFEIRMEELIGKTDEAIQTLSVDTQQQLDQWKEWIELGINSEQRRTSLLTTDNNRETTTTNSTPTRAKSLLSSVFPTIENNDYISPTDTSESISELQIATESLSIQSNQSVSSVDNSKTSTAVVDETALPLPVMNRPQKPLSRKPSRTKEFLSSEIPSYETTNNTPITAETDNTSKSSINNEHETTVPFTANTSSLSKLLNKNKDNNPGIEVSMDDVYADRNTAMTMNPLASRRKASTTAATTTPPPIVSSTDNISTATTTVDTSTVTTVPDIGSPDGKALADRLEAKLSARRQSFKPPNFKNLLKSKGTEAPRRSSGLGSELNSDSEAISTATTTNQSQQRQPLSMVLRSSVTPSPLPPAQPITDQHIQLPESNTGESPTLPILSSDNNTAVAAGEGLQPRRSFTKSPARRRTSKKSTSHSSADASTVGIVGHEGDSSRSVTPSPIPTDSIAQQPHPLTRHLKIRVRPTEPLREGYLFKLDTAHHEEAEGLGQDVWLLQFAKLDITTGLMQVFSEINGKRIQRSKFDVNACTIKSIDTLFHSRLHCFKVSYRPDDNPNEKKLTTVFAASDEETRNYWLVSFEDCEVYYHTHMNHIHNPTPLTGANSATTTSGDGAMQPAGIAEKAIDSSTNPLLAKPIAVVATAASAISLNPTSNNNNSSGTTDSTIDNKTTSEPGKITPADLMNALKKRNSIKTPVVAPAILMEDEDEEQLHSASMHPFAAALHSRFASAPAVGKTQTKASTLIDATPYSSSEAMSLQRVNTLNMDQLLNMSPQVSPMARTQKQPATNPLPLLTEEETSTSTPTTVATSPKYNYTNYKVTMNKLHYPAERLARRIKIWYCSSGFSLSNSIEVEQFVKELKNTGDKVLIDFSEEKFGELHDWANLLAVLRKYEQRKMIETMPKSPSSQHCTGIKLDLTLNNNATATTTIAADNNNKNDTPTTTATTTNKESGKDESVQLQINADISALEIAQQISKYINIPEKEIIESAGLTQLLFNKETNVLGRAMGVLNDDLTFAEDLLLYQEEVIDRVWANLEAERLTVKERDETIEQLYQRLTAIEEATKRGRLSSISHPVLDNPSWLEEKNTLIQVHNDQKVKYITEIQTLRKALGPTTEEMYKELKKSQYINTMLEDEVVHKNMEKDALKAEVAKLQDQLQETEDERSAMAAHWQEQLDALRSEHTKAIAKLHEDVQKAQMEAKKSADEAASVRRLSVKTAAPFTVPSTASAAPSTVNSIAPSPAPSPVPQSTLLATAPDYTFSADHNAAAGRPGAFSTTASTAQSSAAPSPYLGSPMDSTDQSPAVITIANSRNFSPKRTAESSNNPRYTNKPYVNRYASFEDPSEQKPFISPAPVTANTGTQQQQQQYQPYSYSMELKEDAHVPVQGALQLKAPSPEMWGIASGPNSTHSARSGAGTGMAPLHTAGSGSFSGNTSVASLRRDELIDPDDEHDGAYIPSEQAQQQRASINNDSNKAAAASSSGGWSTAKKAMAMHNSFRMMRLPQSGNSSPMPPIASFPNTPTGNSSSSMPPPSPSATLQIPRAQVKPNPIRAAIRNDSLQRQGSSKGKSGGAYITPHATSYAVMPATGPGGGVPSPMVSPLTQQQHSFSFMSATKTSSRSKELVRESAREKFANTYTYQK